jgi:cation diffusion facilitator family transporter
MDIQRDIQRDVNQERQPSVPSRALRSKRVVFVAMLADIGIAISKFVAAGATGSSAMLVEGIHSSVDTGNELLLLLGIRNSHRPPDEWHPFGYGKALYFWALIVALSLFSLGGGMSIYHGIISLRNPHPLEDPTWDYIVLAVAATLEGYSWNVGRKKLNERRHPGESLWEVVHRSKDASVFTVFMEDSASLIGLAVALVGIVLGHALNNPYIDPAASVVIGLVLVAAAFTLARETGDLLVGESMDRDQIVQLRKIISGDPAVEAVGHLLTMQLGPGHVLLVVAVKFRPDLRVDEADQAINRMEYAIKTKYPSIQHIYIESGAFRSSSRPAA